ncbi:MAG: NUDIX domain-containing protein [Candidatus Micrarchaeota archaeon]
MIKEKSCGIILFMEQKLGLPRIYLLLHYVEGHWDFTKGHVEPGESEINTALREVKEETGIIDLDLIGGFKEILDYKYTRNKEQFHKDVLFFLARSKNKNINLSHEHTEFLWLSYGEARKRLTYENAKKILDKAHTFLNNK